MKIEKLNHSKFKVLLYTLISGVVLIFIIVFQTSKASYRTTQSINIANGKINYKVPDLRVVAIKLQDETDNTIYNDSNTIPTSGYTLNTNKSVCGQPDGNGYATSDSSIVMKYEDGYMLLGNLKKNTRCYLYFDIDNGINLTLAGINMTAKKGSTLVDSICADASCSGLYYVSDGMYGGTTYYYRGAVNNNWVKFAGIYWRIIRFNGDGSIRMIYSGTTAPTSETQYVMTGTETGIYQSSFNTTSSKAEYVGYYYTEGEAHGRAAASKIAERLNTWYISNLSSYSSYIDQSGKYCNDRSSSGNGYGTDTQRFGPISREYTNIRGFGYINMSCTDYRDIFATNIGLISSDEVFAAGGLNIDENRMFYLYTNVDYWTLSPMEYTDRARCLLVYSGGNMNAWVIGVDWGSPWVRPVINLKSTCIFTGSGTYDDVYEIAS